MSSKWSIGAPVGKKRYWIRSKLCIYLCVCGELYIGRKPYGKDTHDIVKYKLISKVVSNICMYFINFICIYIFHFLYYSFCKRGEKEYWPHNWLSQTFFAYIWLSQAWFLDKIIVLIISGGYYITSEQDNKIKQCW